MRRSLGPAALALAASVLLVGLARAEQGQPSKRRVIKTHRVPAKPKPKPAPPPESAEPAEPAPAATGAQPAAAAQPAAPPAYTVDTVTRGGMQALVRVKGSVRAEQIFRLASTIEGRVEDVSAKPLSWADGGTALAYVLSKEMAAMMDARSSTPGQVLEQRWQVVYKPTPVGCSDECFVLKVFAKPKAWIQPDTLLFEAARRLRLVGRVRPYDSHLVQNGQILTYWDVKDPGHRQQTRIDRFIMDVQGEKVQPGGTVTVLLDHDHYLDPGTEWEGTITAVEKKDVLRVPTSALISYNGEVFLAVRVSTGITTTELTEITAGVSAKDRFLVIPTTGPALQSHAPVFQPRPQPRDPRQMSEEERLNRRREELGVEPIPEEKHDEYDDEFPSDLHRGSGYE